MRSFSFAPASAPNTPNKARTRYEKYKRRFLKLGTAVFYAAFYFDLIRASAREV